MGCERSAAAPEVRCDVAVIGAGPAGLAAAVAARQAGAAQVLVLEREPRCGGVLHQCVHDGFGLHLYGRSLTGPEYAERWEEAVAECGARVARETTVVGAGYETGRARPFRLEAVGAPLGGRATVRARAVVAATGCRERTRGQLGIPGTRPSGVMTAGAAQYLMNVANQLPGDKVVVLGSGDIGLIMARRLTLEGAEVRLVLGQKSTGLLRNHLRCIQDFSIPLREGWGVMAVHGAGTLKGVTVAPLLSDGTFDAARREYVRCNLLLLACGLVPEREALAGLAADTPGLFWCGNALEPHDLVDAVTQEGLLAGFSAARAAGAAGSLDRDTERLLGREVREPKGRGGAMAAADGRRLLACTVCPAGCIVTVDEAGAVEGAGCPRGQEYARSELACPMRLFTGTARVEAGCAPLVPVRTAGEVPRDALRAVARAVRRVRATAPVRVGQVLHPDIAGTGAALVACASVPAAEGGVR